MFVSGSFARQPFGGDSASRFQRRQVILELVGRARGIRSHYPNERNAASSGDGRFDVFELAPGGEPVTTERLGQIGPADALARFELAVRGWMDDHRDRGLRHRNDDRFRAGLFIRLHDLACFRRFVGCYVLPFVVDRQTRETKGF
jgi:hypothetical protein